MGFRNYNLGLFFFLSAVIILSFIAGWSFHSGFIHLFIIVLLLISIIGILLFRYINSTNREVLFFFKALENEDTSIQYKSKKRNRIIDELHEHLNSLNVCFTNIKKENELQEQYFKKIIENISGGLMIISQTGYINHINRNALDLLNIPELTHVKALRRINNQLPYKLLNLKNREKLEIEIRNKMKAIKKVIGIQSSEMLLGGEKVKIITLHDLSAEMERKEIDDWIRLIRILSHEIMNSLAPITSISTTLKELWTEKSSVTDKFGTAIVHRTLKGLDAISEQSEGLTAFFESYRLLSRIPEPQIKEFDICHMFDKLQTLIEHDLKDSKVRAIFDCIDRDLSLKADEQMITNVLINLIRNAAQALESEEKGVIRVKAEKEKDTLTLSVKDNGPGIPDDIKKEIFMPFFTTRKKGSGVGLSYSRQVMNMHGGKIEFVSEPGGTEFRLVFNA